MVFVFVMMLVGA